MKRKLTYVVPFVLPFMLLGCDQNTPNHDNDTSVQQEAPNHDDATDQQNNLSQSPSDSEVSKPTDSAEPNNPDPVASNSPNSLMDNQHESANPEVGNNQYVVKSDDVVDMHNAHNSLDMDGVYHGKLKVGGVDNNVVLTLDNDRYTYQSGSQQKSGELRWRDQDDTITLYDGQNPFLTMKVAEDKLIVTDQQGNPLKDSKGEEINFSKQLSDK